METVTTLIPQIGPHPDTGELIQLPPVFGECPKSCIFLQLVGAGIGRIRFNCAMAENMPLGLDETTHQRELMEQKDRYPGPGKLDCPAGLGFDGKMLYLNPAMYDLE